MVMFFSISELFDVIIMCLALGFIFKDFFRSHAHRQIASKTEYDPIAHFKGIKKLGDFSGFKMAIIVTAPAIIFHELGHKIIAMSYGLHATFHAAYTWLGLGILLKILNFGFIFFVPAYVSIMGKATYLEHSIIAFAGPAVNLILFSLCWYLLRQKSFIKKHKKWISVVALTKKINLFLFVFNMLPIPMFDGFSVYEGIIRILF